MDIGKNNFNENFKHNMTLLQIQLIFRINSNPLQCMPIYFLNYNILYQILSCSICIHRWKGSLNSTENLEITAAKLSGSDSNVIVVDWSELTAQQSNINEAIDMLPLLADSITNLIQILHQYLDVPLSQIHIVGFEMGAHLAGFVGKRVYQQLGNHIKHITGLNPVNVPQSNAEVRLSLEAAEFVDIIHTNAEFDGYIDALGHADYYPNGLSVQPNCEIWGPLGPAIDVDCLNNRAIEFAQEMWGAADNKFLCLRCSTITEMSLHACNWLNVKMGTVHNQRGIFYLPTNGAFPFGRGSFEFTFW